MADQFIQLAAPGSGSKVDVSELTVSAQTVERQRINISDPTAAAGLAGVSNAQPGASDYGLTVRPAGDGNVVLNATAITSAATLWTGDVSGYQSFQFQVTGSFVATVAIEGSDDNSNWNTHYFFNSASAQSQTISANFTAAVTNGHGPIRSKFLRVRCSAFTSNSSSAVNFVLRTGQEPLELVNVGNVSGTVTVTPSSTAPGFATGSTAFVKAAATTNATSVKASAGNILGGVLINNSGTQKFVKFYNKASAPTVGTDIPVAVFGLLSTGGTLNLADNGFAFARFSTGIAYAITGAVGDADTTAVAVNDISGWIIYQ